MYTQAVARKRLFFTVAIWRAVREPPGRTHVHLLGKTRRKKPSSGDSDLLSMPLLVS